MTTQDYQRKRPLMIFLHYFKNHWKLFLLDITCAVLIAAIDLAFPLITRTALYEWLPNHPGGGRYPGRPVQTHAGVEL